MPQTNTEVSDSLTPSVTQSLRELEILGEVTELFITDSTQKFEELAAAIRAEDTKAVAGVAHSIKGSALNIGAMPLAKLLASIEEQARIGVLEDAPTLFELVKSEFQNVIAALRSLTP